MPALTNYFSQWKDGHGGFSPTSVPSVYRREFQRRSGGVWQYKRWRNVGIIRQQVCLLLPHGSEKISPSHVVGDKERFHHHRPAVIRGNGCDSRRVVLVLEIAVLSLSLDVFDIHWSSWKANVLVEHYAAVRRIGATSLDIGRFRHGIFRSFTVVTGLAPAFARHCATNAGLKFTARVVIIVLDGSRGRKGVSSDIGLGDKMFCFGS